MGVGVLADVQRGQVQAERGHRADRRGQPADRGELPGVAGQRGAHQLQVGDQLVGAEVVAAGHVRGAAAPAACRVLASLALMQRTLSRYGSSALTRRNRVGHLGQAVQVGLARLADRSRETPRSRRETDSSSISVVHRRLGGLDAVLVLDEQHVAGDGRGDERVAVAVAADPGAEGQRPGRRRRSPRPARAACRPGRRAPAGAASAYRSRQVVDRVAGLVGRVRAGPAAARRSARAGRSARRGGGRPGRSSVGAVEDRGGGLGVQLVGDRRAAWTGSSGGRPRSGGR